MGDRQVFIGNLCNLSNDLLRAYCETYGPLTELSINRDKENNMYHCFAFVTFQLTRSTIQFMSNRPHFINGEEVFAKRALPRSTASIPERLLVTNRLILQDPHKHDKRLLRSYFQRFGHIKKFDVEHGFIDYEDYDDVDCVLLARPHYIRDREISVTKYAPSERHEKPDRHRARSNSRHTHRARSAHVDEQPDRIITTSTDTMKLTCINKIERKSSESAIVDQPGDDEDDGVQSADGETDETYLNTRYEQLEEHFEEYKQSKEIEICSLKMDLERIKRQLTDTTQEKLNLLIKNQQLLHQDLLLRLSSSQTSSNAPTVQEFLQSIPSPSSKKRKLTPSMDREYEYYS